MATAVEVKRDREWDYRLQPKVTISNCNVCNGEKFAVLAKCDRYGFPVETHACLTCGLIFLNPRMTAQAYQEFYKNIYRALLAQQFKKTYSPDRLKAIQRGYARWLGGFIGPFLRPSMTLLDIGGSTGAVAQVVAQEFGCSSATVVDPAEDGDAEGVQFVRESFEDFEGKARWDLVLMCQTIDHLLDLKGGIEKARALTTPNGLFFVDIADMHRSLRFYKGLHKTLKVDHPYYLTEETAEFLLARSGFEVLRKTYAMSPYHVGYLCRPSVESRPAFPDARQILREVMAW